MSRSQKWSAAGPLPKGSTRDGDIGPGSRNPYTPFPITAPSLGRPTQKHLFVRSEVAADGGTVDPVRLMTPVNVTDATPRSMANECAAASTIAAARRCFFCSVRALYARSMHYDPYHFGNEPDTEVTGMVHLSRLAHALPKRRSSTATVGTASLRRPPRARGAVGVSWPICDCIFRVGD